VGERAQRLTAKVLAILGAAVAHGSHLSPGPGKTPAGNLLLHLDDWYVEGHI
jgi:hypothetical protein